MRPTARPGRHSPRRRFAPRSSRRSRRSRRAARRRGPGGAGRGPGGGRRGRSGERWQPGNLRSRAASPSVHDEGPPVAALQVRSGASRREAGWGSVVAAGFTARVVRAVFVVVAAVIGLVLALVVLVDRV